MATILPDRDVRRLLGNVLLNADSNLVNPNGIELRLGKHVLFHSTEEEKELTPGSVLKVHPGESVSISSIEMIDFTAPTVQQLFPDSMLMGLITPTTTMMREGISLVSTKIDAGFRGILNWGLRNGSTKDLLIQYGEPIFKLTVFCLGASEAPDIPYGARPEDSYQDVETIMRSARKIPADIPKSKLVSSSFEQLDHKKLLREAGYPFDHIGTELTTLHGKFEVVSADVRVMRDDFQRRSDELVGKLQSESAALSTKIEESRKSLLETVEALFDRKFFTVVGIVVGLASMGYGAITFLEATALSQSSRVVIAAVLGVGAILVTFSVARRRRSGAGG